MSDHDPSEDALADARLIRIMRYCDGTLSAVEAKAIEAEIARDPEAARLAEELRSGRDAARAAWADAAQGPVPLDLVRHLSNAARGQSARPISAGGPWRVAAVLVLGMALGAGGLSLLRHRTDMGLRLAGIESAPAAVAEPGWMPVLVTALQKDPELTRMSAEGNVTIAVTRWFDTATGLRCAEFVKSTANANAKDSGGVACRKQQGGWDVIAQDPE